MPGLHRKVCKGTHRGAGRECQSAWNALLPSFPFRFFFGRVCGAGRCASEGTLSGSVPTSRLGFLTCRGWKAPYPPLPGPCASSSDVCASAAFQAAVNWMLSRLSYTRVPDRHPVTCLSHLARASCLPCHPCPPPRVHPSPLLCGLSQSGHWESHQREGSTHQHWGSFPRAARPTVEGKRPWVQGEKPLHLAKGITLVQSGGRTTQPFETGALS